jgi:hypothetical protein
MQLDRRVFAGIAAVTVFGYAILSSAGPVLDESCGLGVPPGSPDFAEFEARQAAQAERNGFLQVCESNLARYEIAAGLKPLGQVMAGLAFGPVELAGTPFAKLTSLGGMAESVTNVKSRLYRSFRLSNGRTVTLFEQDMSADGSQSYRNPKDEPERINGLPARLVVMQASSGKAVSNLSWKEGRRSYELWMDANVTLEHLRPQLFALAASLPASVPARLHEPELSPFVLGPDGFPHDSFPATLSDEVVRGIVKEKKR